MSLFKLCVINQRLVDVYFSHFNEKYGHGKCIYGCVRPKIRYSCLFGEVHLVTYLASHLNDPALSPVRAPETSLQASISFLPVASTQFRSLSYFTWITEMSSQILSSLWSQNDLYKTKITSCPFPSLLKAQLQLTPSCTSLLMYFYVSLPHFHYLSI